MKAILLIVVSFMLLALSQTQAQNLILFDGDWTPAQLGSSVLKVWVEVEDVTASPVDSWTDKSGNGNHLLKVSDPTRPTLVNGYADFDGTNQNLHATAFTLTQPTTVYIVLRQYTWTLNDGIFDGENQFTGCLRQRDTTPQFMLQAGAAPAGVNVLALDTQGILRAVFNGASSSIRVNGGSVNTMSSGTNDMGGFYLGRTGLGTTAYGDFGTKAVLVIQGTLSASNDTKVMNYLNKKYPTY